jgi:hypothetical protein
MRNPFTLIGLLTLVVAQSAEQPVSKLVFDGRSSAAEAQGKRRTVHLNVQNLYLDGDDGESQTLVVSAFSVFNLVSGRIQTTIGIETTTRHVDDFWTARAGTLMKVRVLGEGAILRTIRVTE